MVAQTVWFRETHTHTLQIFCHVKCRGRLSLKVWAKVCEDRKKQAPKSIVRLKIRRPKRAERGHQDIAGDFVTKLLPPPPHKSMRAES